MIRFTVLTAAARPLCAKASADFPGSPTIPKPGRPRARPAGQCQKAERVGIGEQEGEEWHQGKAVASAISYTAP